ncbi:MAG: sulfotransferase [Gammaproteobacteria bacterium]
MITSPPTPQPDRNQANRCYQEGLEYLENGDEQAAQSAFRRALTFDGSLATIHYQLGNCLRRSGDSRGAEQALKAAIARDVSLKEAYISLTYLYRRLGRLDEAANTLLALARANSSDVQLHYQVANLLAELGCQTEAASTYETCLRLQPHEAQTHLKLGQSYQKLGRFEDAEGEFLAAIEQDSNTDAAYLLLAHTRRLQSHDAPLLEKFEAALTQPRLSEETRICLHFSLGKMYDDLKSYDQAFEHYREGNSLHHQRVRFDRQALVDYVDAVKANFTPELFKRKHSASTAVGSRLPVFVVGMLRSGTSLVERILTSHPRAFGLGETELVDTLAEQLAARTGIPYPGCVIRLDKDLAKTLAAEMRSQWPIKAQTATRIVDKNPLNFLHLGLIALVFPGTPILHCTRNHLDTCLSIYFQYFAHPRNTYAYDLEDIAFFYKQYTVLMNHWRSVLPKPLHECRYEELVMEPERVTRALVAAAGLEWHPDCLEPHKHPASISTASLWQVRQPIYRESAGRWRHYSRYMGLVQKNLELTGNDLTISES